MNPAYCDVNVVSCSDFRINLYTRYGRLNYDYKAECTSKNKNVSDRDDGGKISIPEVVRKGLSSVQPLLSYVC